MLLDSFSQAAEPVNRLSAAFDRFLNNDVFAPLATATGAVMPLSLWQDELKVYVEIDTPGMSENDIEASVHDGVLTIRGERKCTRQERGFDNRRYGGFEQRICLPADVDAEKVEARLSNGVLSLTLPKSEAAKPRRIAISVS